MLDEATIQGLKWNENGLIAAIVQNVHSGQVLMMAWMNSEALQMTLETGEAVFYSRSRATLWHKGETSGNTQRVVEIRVDCDADTLLLQVEPKGPACHTGNEHCFFRTLDEFSQKPERL
ncbi:phosphoribosyl-AMP cyclohydrolase [Phototrophicus methaneseepsis]|uniref:phosphoribosyl-AMP cyclohydrolase n=1 Tax=Phototrophicus methaneseepsis TaxID=2710758 RepID=UPI001E480014|nr:phosphoribosyl-AMP cyclohydrolase [Phototrophicus methaneseepsis]